jgi:hypothetical protein
LAESIPHPRPVVSPIRQDPVADPGPSTPQPQNPKDDGEFQTEPPKPPPGIQRTGPEDDRDEIPPDRDMGVVEDPDAGGEVFNRSAGLEASLLEDPDAGGEIAFGSGSVRFQSAALEASHLGVVEDPDAGGEIDFGTGVVEFQRAGGADSAAGGLHDPLDAELSVWEEPQEEEMPTVHREGAVDDSAGGLHDPLDAELSVWEQEPEEEEMPQILRADVESAEGADPAHYESADPVDDMDLLE